MNKKEKELKKIQKADKDGIVDRFIKLVTFVFTSVSTLMSLTFLIVAMALGQKNVWITASLIVLTVLNALVSFLMVFVFYKKRKTRAAKLVREGIKILRICVAVASTVFTISIWFTTYASSAFMSVMVAVFTIFYGITVLIQLTLWVKKVSKIIKNKRNEKSVSNIK